MPYEDSSLDEGRYLARANNGTNFAGANRDMKEALADLKKIIKNRKICWAFVQDTASHYGGV